MRIAVVFSLLFVFSSGLVSWSTHKASHPQNSPVESLGLPAYMRLSPQWALEKLETLSLEEKIAQSFMVELTPRKGEAHLKVIDSLIKEYKIGGLITFQGTTEETKTAIQRFQEQSTLPLLIGIDGEWGANMRIHDQPRYPFQLTMGAANQLESTKIIAQAMAKDLNELGVHLNFSPV